MSKGRRTTKIRKPNPKTDALAMKMLGHHIPYEVNMLRALFEKLTSPSPDKLTRNAFIESFHMHARNLIEFFKDDDQCVVDPRRFTASDYQIEGDFISRNLETKISQQIVHLTAQRVDNDGLKLDNKERNETIAAIDKQIARFEKNLTPENKMVWQNGLKEMAVVDPSIVTASQVLGPSNAIIQLSSANATGSVVGSLPMNLGNTAKK
jgi:hypothetical protein